MGRRGREFLLGQSGGVGLTSAGAGVSWQSTMRRRTISGSVTPQWQPPAAVGFGSSSRRQRTLWMMSASVENSFVPSPWNLPAPYATNYSLSSFDYRQPSAPQSGSDCRTTQLPTLVIPSVGTLTHTYPPCQKVVYPVAFAVDEGSGNAAFLGYTVGEEWMTATSVEPPRPGFPGIDPADFQFCDNAYIYPVDLATGTVGSPSIISAKTAWMWEPGTFAGPGGHFNGWSAPVNFVPLGLTGDTNGGWFIAWGAPSQVGMANWIFVPDPTPQPVVVSAPQNSLITMITDGSGAQIASFSGPDWGAQAQGEYIGGLGGEGFQSPQPPGIPWVPQACAYCPDDVALGPGAWDGARNQYNRCAGGRIFLGGYVIWMAYLGQIIETIVTNPGGGYISAPTVTFSGGNPSTPATAEATIDTNTGKVTNVQITNPGSGYTSCPTISLTPGSGGNNAESAVNVAGVPVPCATLPIDQAMMYV